MLWSMNMMNSRPEYELRPVPGFVFGLAGALATASIVVLAAFSASQPADALPAYAQKTGLACGRCHVNPAGGGTRTSFGNAFLANGHTVPSGTKSGKSVDGKKEASTAVPAAPAIAPLAVYDYAQAAAWSLRHPYYSHFLYSPDDYRN
jgi:mono/diheme cytochrome c family protein